MSAILNLAIVIEDVDLGEIDINLNFDISDVTGSVLQSSLNETYFQDRFLRILKKEFGVNVKAI